MLGKAPPHKPHAHDTASPTSDAARFEQFFQRYEPQITGFLWRMLGDADAACDLCQETFIRAWQHFATVADYPKPASWLFRVASNLALNHVRRPQAVPFNEEFAPAGSDPGNRVVARELVRQTLMELAPKSRALLVLRDVYAFGYADIGQCVQMTPAAVKMAISRAREQFRQIYRAKDGEHR